MSDPERVHEALVFAEQIAERGDSHYSASLRGGSQFIGWDEDRDLAAHTDDVLMVILSALGGSKLTPADLWPRPEKAAPEVGTIADFNTLAFMRMLGT